MNSINIQQVQPGESVCPRLLCAGCGATIRPDWIIDDVLCPTCLDKLKASAPCWVGGDKSEKGERMSDHTNNIIWHDISPITGELVMPDADAEIIIYDQLLDDVVLGHLDDIGFGVTAWIDDSTGYPLPEPLYWAEKPFPAGV